MELENFFYHADDKLFEKWQASGGTAPLVVDLLDMPDYEADKHYVIETDNPFIAFQHAYDNSGDIAAITEAEHDTRRWWCEWNGRVWLFATFQMKSHGYGSNDYTLDIRCHFNSEFGLKDVS